MSPRPAAAPGPDFRPAFLINLVSTGGGALLRFGVFVLLARLLTPAELGVYAIAAALLGLAQVLRDGGVGAWLQREAELTQAKVGAALGLLCCSGALSACLLGLAGAPLARAFGAPQLRELLPLLALGLALMPLQGVVAALLQRELAAARLAAIARAGGAAHALTALALAWAGWGALGLAWAQLANVAACGIACWLLRPQGWQWRPTLAGWRAPLRFGRGALPANLLQALHNALPELLLGRLGSAQQVGLLGRAQATVNLLGAVAGGAIGFGALSRFATAQRQGTLAPQLARAIALLTGVAWPLLGCSVLLGPELVLLLFGPGWLDCVPALPALAVLAALTLAFGFDAAALAAVGRPGLAALPLLASALARLLLALLFFGGGVADFAALLLAAALLALPVQLRLQARVLGLGPAMLLRALLPSLGVTLACAGAVGLLLQALPPHGPAGLTLALALPVALLAWYGALRWTAHPLAGELQGLLSGRFLITIRK